jgi:hypothetical protein
MALILTSIRNSRMYRGLRCSVSVDPVEGFLHIPHLSESDENNQPVAVGELSDPVNEFMGIMQRAFKSRWDDIGKWLDSLCDDPDVVLACSCPYNGESERTLSTLGMFLCHTGLIGKLVQKHRPDIHVIMDDDRERFLPEKMRPVQMKCSICSLKREEGTNCPELLERHCAGPYVMLDGGFRSIHHYNLRTTEEPCEDRGNTVRRERDYRHEPRRYARNLSRQNAEEPHYPDLSD